MLQLQWVVPLGVPWSDPGRCKAIDVLGQVSVVAAVCVPDADTCTLEYDRFVCWICHKNVNMLPKKIIPKTGSPPFPQHHSGQIKQIPLPLLFRFLPGATVTCGNWSSRVFLMVWNPKDVSSYELTGSGSKPFTSSIFTLSSPTVDWMNSRTWQEDTNTIHFENWGEFPWTVHQSCQHD